MRDSSSSASLSIAFNLFSEAASTSRCRPSRASKLSLDAMASWSYVLLSRTIRRHFQVENKVPANAIRKRMQVL